MKCRSQVFAALEEPRRERPVVPGASRTRSCPSPAEFGPQPAKWMTAIAAMTRAIRVSQVDAPARGSCRGAGGLRAEPSSAPLIRATRGRSVQAPDRQPDNDQRYGTGSNSAEGPEELRRPDQEGQREDGGCQRRRRARELGEQPPANRGRRPARRSRRAARISSDAQQVARRRRASLAAAQQAGDLLQLGDPQQLRGRHVDERRRAPRPAPRETIWPTRPRPSAWSSTSQTPQLTPASAAAAIVIRDRRREQPAAARGRRTRGAGSAPGRRPRRSSRSPVPATMPPTPKG